MEESPGMFVFLGRFHPLLVHLPIGFLSLIILYEFSRRWKGLKKLASTVNVIWLLSAISAVLSVMLGWMLSSDGGYDEETLRLHKWSGIALAMFSILGYFSTRKPIVSKIFYWGYKVLVVVVAILLIVAGHQGGTLTHGEDYLFESTATQRPDITSLDSADVYADAIAPILNARCASCHNQSKRKGKLVLTSYDAILKGGKSGLSMLAGNLDDSELHRRITLPREDEEFMPAEGKKPLTEEQLEIITWWIEKGAPQKATITSLAPDQNMITVFEKFFGIGISKEIIVSPADTADLNVVSSHGFVIRKLARTSNLVEAHLLKNKSGKEGIAVLSKINEQLFWLFLNNSQLQDDDLASLSRLTQLRKLNLSNNPITDKSIRYLMQLKDLEYLNLYNTHLSDAGVDSLMTLPSLKQLYVWQTNVTHDHMEKCKASKPELTIIYQSPE